MYFEVTSGNFTFTCEDLPGDLNADGTVDSKDATLLRKMLIGSEKVTSAADVNGDGKTNICDLVALQKRI
ncbi:MAG: dockerin type I repeat-containing protein [Acutalibacteraceae bacterium]|nr:dockerin type I repeat-containing protein [Acutalibacteraceae bacterium]